MPASLVNLLSGTKCTQVLQLIPQQKLAHSFSLHCYVTSATGAGAKQPCMMKQQTSFATVCDMSRLHLIMQKLWWPKPLMLIHHPESDPCYY